MPVQAELVRTVTQSARLSKDQGLQNRGALSLASLTHVKSVAPVCAGHTSPLLCLSSPRVLHSLPAAKKTHQAALGGLRDLLFPMLNPEADKERPV